MPKGDIVLIPFPYTNLSGNKLRPALVVLQTEFDVVVAFITTKLQWQETTDMLLYPSVVNGIKKPSLVRLNKLATIDKDLIIGIIGSINQVEQTEINVKLKIIFGLK